MPWSLVTRPATVCALAVAITFLNSPLMAQTQQVTSPAVVPASDTQDGFDLFRRVPRGFGLQVQVGSFFTQDRPPTDFTIPESLRTVPTHPDDGYPPGTQWTIPMPHFTTNDPEIAPQGVVAIAPEFTIWRVTARAGARIVPGPSLTSSKPMPGDSIPEINQEGTSDRGYGQSLVYYFVYWQPKVLTTARPFEELELRINKWVSLIGGYGKTASAEGVALENGWDRYDAFQTHLTQEIASVEQNSGPFYGAVRIAVGGPFVGFRIGYTSTRSRLTLAYPGVYTSLPASRGVLDGIFWAMDVGWTQSKAEHKKNAH